MSFLWSYFTLKQHKKQDCNLKCVQRQHFEEWKKCCNVRHYQFNEASVWKFSCERSPAVPANYQPPYGSHSSCCTNTVYRYTSFVLCKLNLNRFFIVQIFIFTVLPLQFSMKPASRCCYLLTNIYVFFNAPLIRSAVPSLLVLCITLQVRTIMITKDISIYRHQYRYLHICVGILSELKKSGLSISTLKCLNWV